MRTSIKTTNLKRNPTIEALVSEKLLGPVEKLLGKLDQKTDIIFEIELGRTTKHHNKGKIWRAEAQLSLPYRKKVLRAEACTESLRASVDEVKYELIREIKKYKEKRLASNILSGKLLSDLIALIILEKGKTR